MAVVKIRPKRQITIPKQVFQQLHLETGDFIETAVEQGRIVMIPKRLTSKEEITPLSKAEQKTLLLAKRKIEQIRKDILRSRGLNKAEIEVAVKVGLLDSGQAWWWTEEWQEGEREAEKDIKQGRIAGHFRNAQEFLKETKSKSSS